MNNIKNMDKKSLFTVCILCTALLSPGLTYADDDSAEHSAKYQHSYLSGFGCKLSQGLANMVTGVGEIPKNVINISHDDNIFVGVTWGLLRGVMETVGRTTVGVAEFITSPIPSRPYATPPYIWERFSEDSRYFGLHLPGFWTTYGPLDHGENWGR